MKNLEQSPVGPSGHLEKNLIIMSIFTLLYISPNSPGPFFRKESLFLLYSLYGLYYKVAFHFGKTAI